MTGELREESSGPRKILTFQTDPDNKGPLVLYERPSPRKRYAAGGYPRT